jgi:iron complex outermembrane receptor protein
VKKSLTTYLLVASPLAFLSTQLFSQTARPAPTTANKGDEVIELSPFVAAASPDESKAITETTTGSLISRPMALTPIAIDAISSEMMAAVGMLNGEGLSTLVAGVASQNNANTNGDANNTQYTQRGFNSLPKVNGFSPGGRLFDSTDIDRVEIVRGPNSLLYGASDPGGIINYVTKRSAIRNATGVRGTTSVDFGSYDFFRGYADVDATVVPSKLGVRVPASYTDQKRPLDFWHGYTRAISPSLVWRVLPRTEIYVICETLSVQVHGFGANSPRAYTPPGYSYPILSRDQRGLGVTENLNYGPFSTSVNKQKNWIFEVTSRLTDHLTFKYDYSKNSRDRSALVPYNGNFMIAKPTGWGWQNGYDGNRINGYKADLLAEYNVGPFVTRTIVGHEYNENDYFSWTWRTKRTDLWVVDVGYNPTTLLATRNPGATPFVPLAFEKQDPANWNLSSPYNRLRGKWDNSRISEVLSGFDNRLQLMGGVAKAKAVNANLSTGVNLSQHASTYQVGLGYVFDRAKQHMVYANQSTSYLAQYAFDVNRSPLPAQSGSGKEVGLKSTWGNSGVSTMVAVFTQRRTNVARNYSDPVLNVSYAILTPGEEVNGWEAQFWFRPGQWEISGAFSHFNGRITGTAPQTPWNLGRKLPKAPETSGNLHAFYRFKSDGWTTGLRIGLGASYAGSTWVDATQAQNTYYYQWSDAATTYWASLTKEFALSQGRRLSLTVNAQNLLDRQTITASNNFSAPRMVKSSVAYRF